MNKIELLGLTFTDRDIISGNVFVSNSPISESLENDTLDFTVVDNGQNVFFTSEIENFITSDSKQLIVGSVNMLTAKYGTPVSYYKDDQLIGKFYVKSIKQVEETQFEFECISLVGIMSYIDHYGGIYGVDSPMYVTDLIEEIVGEDVIAIDSVFDAMRIQGYLPKASVRDNLQQVLFAVGGAILKDENGDLQIKYNQPETAKVLPDDSAYLGETYNRLTHATKVTLIEHSYFEGVTTETKEVFNNLNDITTAINQEIIFTQPYYNYHAYDENGTDITSTFIIDSGVNFVRVGVSGTDKGRITATPYIHSQRQLTKQTGIESIENKEVTVSDATLISPFNSTNALERLASYHGIANEVQINFVYSDEHTGGLVQFKKPFDKNNTQQIGYLKSMDISMSATLKATSTVAVDWTPNHLGNTYNAFKIIDKAELGNTLEADWTVPEELQGKEAYIVMFNGATGGQGGYNGTNGGASSGTNAGLIPYSTYPENRNYYMPYGAGTNGLGGVGGNGGQGGSGCNRYNAVITTLLNAQYHIKLGEGGIGGNANGGLGQEGGETTFANYSSDVHDLTGTYVNLITKDIYCQSGNNGIKGGDGGDGGTATGLFVEPPIGNAGNNGGNVGNKVGGIGTNGATTTSHNHASPGYGSETYWHSNAGGGGGGGASADNNGQAGGNPSPNSATGYIHYSSGAITIITSGQGGKGGNGANAIQPSQVVGNASNPSGYGMGGFGANGGGGGGGAGSSPTSNGRPPLDDGEWIGHQSGGTGGTSTAGGQGSDGFIVIYYTED